MMPDLWVQTCGCRGGDNNVMIYTTPSLGMLPRHGPVFADRVCVASAEGSNWSESYFGQGIVSIVAGLQYGLERPLPGPLPGPQGRRLAEPWWAQSQASLTLGHCQT